MIPAHADAGGLLVLAAGGGAADSPAVALLVILLCAGLVALAMAKLKVATLPAYLICGAIIGPYSLDFVSDPDTLSWVADLAGMLLLFGIGMHMDVTELRRGAVRSLGIGLTSTIASAGIACAVSMACGLSLTESVVIGVALAMSSTAVVARVMHEQRETNRVHGRLALLTLVVQDVLVIAALTLIPLLPGAGEAAAEATHATTDAVSTAGLSEIAQAAEPAAATDAGLPAIVRLGLVIALLVLGKLLLPRILMAAAKTAASDVVLVLAAATALGAAVAGSALGLSAELGAFVAGFLLSSTPVRHQLAGQLLPMRDLFMAVFFTVVGMRMDLSAFAAEWWLVLLLAAAVMVGKAACIGGLTWAWGASAAVSARVGLLLCQAGEFSIIILGIAAAQGLLGPELSTRLLEVVAVTLILTPAVMSQRANAATLVHRWRTAPWVRSAALCDRTDRGPTAAQPAASSGDASSGTKIDHPEGHASGEQLEGVPGLAGHVIIGGFGPVGRACCELLEAAGAHVLIIELNPRTVERQRALGRAAMYGDVSSIEILREAGVDEAAAVIMSIPDDDAVIRACRVIRQLRADLPVVARTSTLSRGNLARVAGASAVTVEELETANAMSRTVMRQLNILPRSRRTDRDPKPREIGEQPQPSA